MLGLVVLASGCVRGEPLAEGDAGCFDDLSCPPGTICSINPLDPTEPGQCISVDGPQPCLNDEQCFRGQECVNQICVDATPNNDAPNNDAPNNDAPNNDAPNNDVNNDVNNDAPNNDPNTCAGQGDCEVFQECCEGRCVDRGTCAANSPCTAQGQPCSLPDGENAGEQGNFICARLEDEAAQGTCLSRCTTPFTADNCNPNSYCIDVGDDANPLPLCLPSDCNSSFDCVGSGANGEDGTCVRFDNNAGFCFTAGTAPQNASCNVQSQNLADRCGVDLFCITENQNPVGVCRSLCDMWNNDTCPFNTACGLLTLETGVCLDQTSNGRQPFDNCSPAGDWCATGSRCFETGTPPNTQNFCLKYCRPNQPFDCNGVAFQGTPSFCELVFVDANDQPDTSVGLCLPPGP